MKSTNSHPPLERSLESGWAVHIYNHRRQLLCSLDPSHGWSFAAGTLLGILLTVVGVNLANPELADSTVIDEPQPKTAPLQLD
jgi:hypothetical protein